MACSNAFFLHRVSIINLINQTYRQLNFRNLFALTLFGTLTACQDPAEDAQPITQQDERTPGGGKGDIIGDDDRRDEFSLDSSYE